MSEAIPEFTENEIAALMVLAQGTGLLALGNWEKALKALVVRGFAKPRQISAYDPSRGTAQAYDYVITDAGKSACEAWENQSLLDVIRVNNEVATQRHDINPGGFSEKQIRALADFYWKMTGRNPSEICPP